MSSAEKKGIARRVAIARWIKERFGDASFHALGLPGGEIADACHLRRRRQVPNAR